MNNRIPNAREPGAIVMLGIHPDSKEKGGISTVVDVYREAGLFARWPIHYIGTVMSGPALSKVRVAIGALSEFCSLLIRGRIQLLHAQTSSRASFWRKSLFVLLALAARRPAIIHLHGSEFQQFYRDECGPLRRAYVRFVLNRAARVIVLSSQWATLVRDIAPRARVVRIFNPISIRADLTDEAPPRDPNGILFLGRFGPRKGIFDLLEAMAIVRRRFPDVKLRCGGDGDIEGVKRKVAELGLRDCVEVLGWVSGSDKRRELLRASLYVLPSYAEGLPMGILEAMAAGLPTVATCVGGIPDAIAEAVEGFLVEPGDTHALAGRINLLLDNRVLREEMAAAARQTASSRFSAEQVIAEVEQVYRELGASPRDRGPETRREPDAPRRTHVSSCNPSVGT